MSPTKKKVQFLLAGMIATFLNLEERAGVETDTPIRNGSGTRVPIRATEHAAEKIVAELRADLAEESKPGIPRYRGDTRRSIERAIETIEAAVLEVKADQAAADVGASQVADPVEEPFRPAPGVVPIAAKMYVISSKESGDADRRIFVTENDDRDSAGNSLSGYDEIERAKRFTEADALVVASGLVVRRGPFLEEFSVHHQDEAQRGVDARRGTLVRTREQAIAYLGNDPAIRSAIKYGKEFSAIAAEMAIRSAMLGYRIDWNTLTTVALDQGFASLEQSPESRAVQLLDDLIRAGLQRESVASKTTTIDNTTSAAKPPKAARSARQQNAAGDGRDVQSVLNDAMLSKHAADQRLADALAADPKAKNIAALKAVATRHQRNYDAALTARDAAVSGQTAQAAGELQTA